MLVVEGEKLFHAYNTSLAEGNLRLFRGPTESECQIENMELWILD